MHAAVTYECRRQALGTAAVRADWDGRFCRGVEFFISARPLRWSAFRFPDDTRCGKAISFRTIHARSHRVLCWQGRESSSLTVPSGTMIRSVRISSGVLLTYGNLDSLTEGTGRPGCRSESTGSLGFFLRTKICSCFFLPTNTTDP
jgi:hypothetical protein